MSTPVSAYDQRAGNEDLIKRLFNKVYTAIISEKIFCPPETAVCLAAYACQAKFGSAKSLRDPVPPVAELIPKSILDNHNLTQLEWETRISNWHLKLRQVPFLDSIVEYLDIAQDVELYGASVYEVETIPHVRKWISLDAVGLNIYDSKKKPPTQRYTWADILSFNTFREKIQIVLVHEPNQAIEFFVNRPISDLLLNLFQGGKELYGRRKTVDPTSKFVRRSESNSSLRMRPHKLTAQEIQEINQNLTELELELPRRATDFEYAPWQVKDQLRQARGIEVKLSLNKPSTEETRRLQRRVADVRVFLEQDFFKVEEEEADRPRKYRGNFAIRLGGAYSRRSDGYSSDIDNFSSRDAPVWTGSPDRTKAVKKIENADDSFGVRTPIRQINTFERPPSDSPTEVKQTDAFKKDSFGIRTPIRQINTFERPPSDSPTEVKQTNAFKKDISESKSPLNVFDVFEKHTFNNVAPVKQSDMFERPPSGSPAVVKPSDASKKGVVDSKAKSDVYDIFKNSFANRGSAKQSDKPEIHSIGNKNSLKLSDSSERHGSDVKPILNLIDVFDRTEISDTDPMVSDYVDIHSKPYPAMEQKHISPEPAEALRMPKIPQPLTREEPNFSHKLSTGSAVRYPTKTPSISTMPDFPAPPNEDSDKQSSLWQHVLRKPEQDTPPYFTKGRIHGQVLAEDPVVPPYHPVIQPKPKVAPHMVQPVTMSPEPHTYEGTNFDGRRSDVKFSSLRVIQSGLAKKRVDLFEAQ